MKGKGSYRARFLKDNPNEANRERVAISISDDIRAEYEKGRVIVIDKNLHWTSFDVVRKIRGALRIKKVGHAGTLDPLATGVLILCTGAFTKKINGYMACEKEYTGSITLGAVTPTYDLESVPEEHKDISGITTEMIRNAAASFLGSGLQMPPIYSAIKKAGVPLYELARKGKDVQPEPRNIIISAFEITSIELPVVTFRVVVSAGTYIRSLAHDMGKLLGCGAYLSALRRTAVGDIRVESAMKLDDFLSSLQTKTDS